MKQAALKSTADVLHKIEAVEKDIMELKLTVLKKFAPSKNNIIKLKGILKGVEITEKDIASAGKSLYSKTGI